MDFFDERILAALKDGKPRGFTMLLGEAGFTHNTLQQHLQRLVTRGLIVKEKMASNNLGRPKFTYRVPSAATRQVTAALQNPNETLVTLQFSRLDTFAGSRRAATAKKQKRIADLKTAPKPENKNYNHFTPISGQASALY
jgi:predicted ArsR family transcriptional regulator